MFIYATCQLLLWWFFHVTAFFWKIKFPFHARSVAKSNRIKYIHIGCVIAGLVLPLVPIIALMGDFAVILKNDEFLRSENATFASSGFGFKATILPLHYGDSFSNTIQFYVLVIPTMIVLDIGVLFLILTIRLIHKVSIIEMSIVRN